LVQEHEFYAKVKTVEWLYKVDFTTMEGPGYFSEKFQIMIRSNKKQFSVLEVKRVSTYFVYSNCLNGANKHACICKIPELGDRIPMEHERHILGCSMGHQYSCSMSNHTITE
jgi:ferredoxin